jgi:hypothetical protein
LFHCLFFVDSWLILFNFYLYLFKDLLNLFKEWLDHRAFHDSDGTFVWNDYLHYGFLEKSLTLKKSLLARLKRLRYITAVTDCSENKDNWALVKMTINAGLYLNIANKLNGSLECEGIAGLSVHKLSVVSSNRVCPASYFMFEEKFARNECRVLTPINPFAVLLVAGNFKQEKWQVGSLI